MKLKDPVSKPVLYFQPQQNGGPGLERYRGLEPLLTAWEAVVLPLHQYRVYPTHRSGGSVEEEE